MSDKRMSRRDAIKRAAYTTPVILTMLAAPSFAAAGSGAAGSGKVKDKKDKKDKKDHKEKRDKRLRIKWKD